MTNPTRITLEDGKYTILNDNGVLTMLRHGEPWPASADLCRAGVVLALVHEVERLRAAASSAKTRIDMTLHIDTGPARGALNALADDFKARIAGALVSGNRQAAPGPDGWITWSGGACPVPRETVVEYRLRSTRADAPAPAQAAGVLDWASDGGPADIVSYRVKSRHVPACSDLQSILADLWAIEDGRMARTDLGRVRAAIVNHDSNLRAARRGGAA